MASNRHIPEHEGRSTHASQDERQEKTTDDEQTEQEEQADDPVDQDAIQYNDPNEVLLSNPEATLSVLEILKRRWMETLMSWRDISHDEREKQWECFLHRYNYIDEHQGTAIPPTWEATTQYHISQILSQAHRVARTEVGSEDIFAWLDSHPKGIDKYVWSQILDQWNIDARKDRTQAAYSNHLVEGGLTKNNDDSVPFIIESNCMDDCTDGFQERYGDSFSYQGGIDLETWIKATTDLGKGQVSKHTPNDTRSNLSKTSHGVHIDNSPRVRPQSRLPQLQMRLQNKFVIAFAERTPLPLRMMRKRMRMTMMIDHPIKIEMY